MTMNVDRTNRALGNTLLLEGVPWTLRREEIVYQRTEGPEQVGAVVGIGAVNRFPANDVSRKLRKRLLYAANVSDWIADNGPRTGARQ